ncbi:MAG: bifunctional demethylmenaquinone methyltransferase/2-methoxy-6-polyprenyl-1,4-benzoquinol methylase UbiE [Gammaproteobacteria bacterium]|nr:bifunctional demethylmenaquinone methyltransferase/2-methoxy-6-polyprenyl-1,4-benzoquinol methylase UbiE [Gammaproteobacteria bacterium]
MTDQPQDTTDFGFQRVPVDDKVRRVGAVFDSVASRYDVMNDLMSLGVHRLWKRVAVELSGVRPGQRVLDLAAGTGDMSARLAAETGSTGLVIASDINRAMLGTGRDRLLDRGVTGSIDYVQANAEALPFPDNSFDVVMMAFGLRNVTYKDRVLQAIERVLRPGGCAVVLEFSHPQSQGFAKVYDLYSFNVLPVIGKLVAGDADSYRYLAESIRKHPDQQTLQAMMEQAGLVRCEHFNLTNGVVAIHRGYKA